MAQSAYLPTIPRLSLLPAPALMSFSGTSCVTDCLLITQLTTNSIRAVKEFAMCVFVTDLNGKSIFQRRIDEFMSL